MAAAINADVWLYWANSQTATTTTLTNVWYAWSGGTGSTGTTISGTTIPVAAYHNEQLRRVAEMRRAQWEETQKARLAADTKAEAFLLQNLSDLQRSMYRAAKQFIVEGARNRYRIRHGARVAVLTPNDNVSLQLCCHPVGVPLCDVMLTQKLMLENPATEDLFLETANRS